MAHFRLLIRCVGEAVAANGLKCLMGLVPFGNQLYEVARDAHERYQRKCDEREALAGIEAAAQATFEEVRAEARQVFKEVKAAAAPEVAAELADPVVEKALVGYLEQVPAAVRSTLRRPADSTGRSVPRGFSVRSPEDFLRLLPARPPRFSPGDRPVGNWQLEDLLGVGGFGEVWKARHPTLRNLAPVALKFCLDDESARSLRHEAGLIDRMMEHSKLPGVVELRNAYLENDPPCLEYEFVPGGDLCGLLHDWQGLEPVERGERATRLIGRLAAILDPLHRLDPPVVHRDLKPANCLVVGGTPEDPLVKVGDFGIGGIAARRSIGEGTRGTARGDLLVQTLRGSHTPLYASPEQVWGSEPDPRDDVHALGVLWYQLLAGDLRRAVGPDLDEELREMHVPTGVVKLLRRSVARAEKRIRHAGELAEHLKELIKSKPDSVSVPAGPAREAEAVVVSPHGDGQYTTITEAIHASTAPRRILVRPGEYRESVVLDREVELVADGPRDRVFISWHKGPCIRMKTERAAVRGFSLRGRAKDDRTTGSEDWQRRSCVLVGQGELLLEDCDVTSDAAAGVFVKRGGHPLLRKCLLHQSVVGLDIDDGRATAVGCEAHANETGLRVGGMHARGEADVEDCTFRGNRLCGIEVGVRNRYLPPGGGRLTARRCTVTANVSAGVLIHEKGGPASIAGCIIAGNGSDGVHVKSGTFAITESTIEANGGKGVRVESEVQGSVESCLVRGNKDGDWGLGWWHKVNRRDNRS